MKMNPKRKQLAVARKNAKPSAVAMAGKLRALANLGRAYKAAKIQKAKRMNTSAQQQLAELNEVGSRYHELLRNAAQEEKRTKDIIQITQPRGTKVRISESEKQRLQEILEQAERTRKKREEQLRRILHKQKDLQGQSHEAEYTQERLKQEQPSGFGRRTGLGKIIRLASASPGVRARFTKIRRKQEK